MSTHVIAMQQKNKSQALGKLSDHYETPTWLMNWLLSMYDLQFDIAASETNHKFSKYFTEQNSAIGANWSSLGSVGFCNPPFSHGMKEKFLQSAYDNIGNGVTSVFVIPADISNDFWLTHIYGRATRLISIVGRVRFIDHVRKIETKTGLGVAVIEFSPDKPPARHGDFEVVKRDDIRVKHKYDHIYKDLL